MASENKPDPSDLTILDELRQIENRIFQLRRLVASRLPQEPRKKHVRRKIEING
jgi:hypothetical protein